ncbi:hypothetical protein GCM10023330_11860 [Litoribaculum gwangyangense]|uniref:Uncharacterized protein n=1 Tax=Litoribaculum gwangyangense TaxID=1130722 RepID=A0ABP9CA30_9FLAO
MAISNCLFSSTSENPRGFSIRFLFAKLGAKHATNHTQTVVPHINEETYEKNNFNYRSDSFIIFVQ